MQKTETLVSILKIVSDPIQHNGLSCASWSDLFNFICCHIFRPLHAQPPANQFSEIYFSCAVKNWEHIDLCHMILQELMLDRQNFQVLLDDRFSCFLVKQLDSPAPEEQAQVENDLHILLQDYAGSRTFILKYMLEKLIMHTDSKLYVSSMAPILRLFMSYFRSLKGKVSQNNLLMFRRVFYPLFGTEFAAEFESELNDLSTFFQSQDAGTSIWCMNYLKRHWPKTSTRKVQLFLRQLSSLLPSLPGPVMEQIGPTVLKILVPLINDENWSISALVMSACGDSGFLCVYQAMPELITSTLIPATKCAAESHWNADIREIASELLVKLIPFEMDGKRMARRRPRVKSEDAEVRWRGIAEAAGTDPNAIGAFFARGEAKLAL